jgi:hypothetical protein
LSETKRAPVEEHIEAGYIAAGEALKATEK